MANTVEELVESLKPVKDQYSPKKIREEILAQGHSERVADRVVKVLYGDSSSKEKKISVMQKLPEALEGTKPVESELMSPSEAAAKMGAPTEPTTPEPVEDVPQPVTLKNAPKPTLPQPSVKTTQPTTPEPTPPEPQHPKWVKLPGTKPLAETAQPSVKSPAAMPLKGVPVTQEQKRASIATGGKIKARSIIPKPLLAIPIGLILAAVMLFAFTFLQSMDFFAPEPTDDFGLNVFAVAKQSYEPCAKIQDSKLMSSCYVSVATTFEDPSACEEIPVDNPLYRDGCYNNLAALLKDASLCDKISDSFKQVSCVRILAIS